MNMNTSHAEQYQSPLKLKIPHKKNQVF